MRRHFCISLTFAVLAVCLMSGSELWAKGGRGGPRGGGGWKHGGRGFKGSGRVRGNGGGNRSGAWSPGGKSHAGHKPSFGGGSKSDASTTGRVGKGNSTSIGSVKRNAATGDLAGSDHPWSKHQAREERKLDHRRQVADHLREISDRNGNEHLQQVADDMEQRAQAHYDKQMEKIRQKYGLDDTTADAGDGLDDLADNRLGGDGDALDDAVDVVDGGDDALDEVARKLTGRENALFRQMRNEERKLTRRMEAVERLRQMATQTGDEDMLQAADQLEDWAMDHFDQRMAQITDFQQRHDLPDVIQNLSQ